MSYGPAKHETRRTMATTIAAKVANPNDWNMTARGVAERIGLDVTRIAFHATLDLTCASIVEEAEKQGRAMDAVRTAIEAT